MTTPQNNAETALQREQRMFSELWSYFLDLVIGKIFDLNSERAARRSSMLFLMFFGLGILISLFYYPPGMWLEQLKNILYSVLSPASAPLPIDAAFTGFFKFLLAVILDPRILQYLPIFLAPFFIAQQSAAIYLADVFELEDVSVARQFINGVALSGGQDTIRIKEGKINEDDMEKPMFLIGGPGRVLVELDSVALFERADGTPHVIGPTGKEPGGKATIGGFERFREALDIRNHYVELRDQDSSSASVGSRSRDGIPIRATDVRLMFSLFRGEKPVVTPENPYPINTKAIENIIYKAASAVRPDLPNPSYYDFNWVNNMIGLIRGKLGGFMSEHNLTEYMASTGAPELEKVQEREDKITEAMKRLGQTDDDSDSNKTKKKPPEFQPRHKIKSLFAQFAEGFTNQARDSGVELKWIGVGTWETQVDLVPEKHLEAWKLAQENLKNDSPAAMNRIEQEEVNEKMKELIRKVPIAAFSDVSMGGSSSKKSSKSSKKKEEEVYYDDDEYGDEYGEFDENGEDGDPYTEILNKLDNLEEMQKEEKKQETSSMPHNSDHAHKVQALLLEYRKQFQETVDFIRNKKQEVPVNILDAIKYIENQIGHWAGRP